MQADLNGCVALVTGANTGIGRVTALTRPAICDRCFGQPISIRGLAATVKRLPRIAASH